MPLPTDVVTAMSREIAVSCDPSTGVVTDADERAQRLLQIKPGEPLASFAPPGTEAKITKLLEAAREHAVSRWEVAMNVEGRPRTLAFSGAPHDGEVILVGSLVPEDYAGALTELNASMSELATLHRELVARKAEVTQLRGDLTDTEKGLAVLNQEVDERTESLKETINRKSRVLAEVSHELRTPISSILGLSGLLLSDADGALSVEQRKQIDIIQRAAATLSALVNDLLDLSKADAGRMTLRVSRFSVKDVFSALRGMLRPLLPSSGVALELEEPDDFPTLETDEGKLSQILRNLISNAIKFTERGEVRVTVSLTGYGAASFRVRDTGIGISADDQRRLFREFSQIDSPRQRKVRGTGLGLALSKRMAMLLAGDILVDSEPGKGSTFTVVVPVVHPEAVEMRLLEQRSRIIDPARVPVLVVEDDRAALLLYERHLAKGGFQIIPARSLEEARAKLAAWRPMAVILDVMLEEESTWTFLADLKQDPTTRDIPVLVVTVIGGEDKARSLGADDFSLKPVDEAWLTGRLRALARRGPIRKVLVIDDDEASRYLIRRYLEGTPYALIEAKDGAEGSRRARDERPDIIFLDLFLPDGSALDVVDELRSDLRTRDIPVVVVSAQPLDTEGNERLAKATQGMIAKKDLSRPEALRRIVEALEARKPELAPPESKG
jgi:signal transduction histidine kinase/CheY-like chemotaxis protein